jgi:LysR family transcriptional regulator, hydrogen peroxide-inducible genes activator
MTLTEMRYLVSLARERHFGRAAERCHVSQPTLSVAIKKVERELGAALFERSAAELRLTPFGERVVEQARRVLAEALKLDEIGEQGRDPLEGPLRIGVIYTIAPYLLPQLVPALHSRAPGMPLYLREDFTANLVPALKQGELDVVLLALPLESPGIVTQALYEEAFRVVVPVGHALQGPVAASQLSADQLLMLGQGNCFRDQVLEACPHLADPRDLADAVEGSSLETLRYMVASGAGVAVMPSTAADPLAEREPLVRVLPFADPEPTRQVGLGWRVTFPRPQAIDAVKAAILGCKLPGTVPRVR